MNQTLKFSFRNLFLSCVCLLLFACGGNPEIISPDGRTRLSFVTGADGCMAYTVERDGKPLILPSALASWCKNGTSPAAFRYGRL